MGAQRPGPGFVGRREQFVLLDAAVRAAQAGEPQFVLFGGEAGVGKTRLLEHFSTGLEEAGWRVPRGACVRLGTEGLPLASITAALRDLVRQLGVDRVSRLLPDADVVLRLLPELDVRGTGQEGQGRLFETFAALLRELSLEHAVLLVIDDLHWADRSTRDLLGLLVRTLRAARVVVVAAYRSDDLHRGHPLRPFLAEIERLAGVHRVELGRFSRAETAELVTVVRGVDPPDALVDSVFRRSAGNPFFAEELVRAGSTDGGKLPGSLRDLLLGQLEWLDASARGVVRTAAVGDPSISHGLLAETAGLGEEALLAGLRAAVDARVLTAEADRDTYRFRHALLREAVLEDLLPAERVRLHRACAEALEAHPDLVAPDQRAAEVAFHWYSANEPDRALPALLRAADAAEAVYAHAEQSQMLLRALEVWPRVTGAAAVAGADRLGIWEKVVAAAVWAGEHLDALDLVQRALAETDLSGERAAMLHALRGRALHDVGRDGVEAAVEQALRALPPAPSVGRARVLDLVSSILMVGRHPQQARELSEEAMRLAADLGDDAVANNARITLAVTLAQLGAHDEGLAVLAEARELTEARGDPMRLTRVHINCAYLLAGVGRHHEAVDAARAGLDLAGQAGLSRTLGAVVSGTLADALVAIGRWDEADAVCAEALAFDPPGRFGANLQAVRGEIALVRGDLDIAREQRALAAVLRGHPSATIPETLPVTNLEAGIALRDNRLEDARRVIADVLPVVSACTVPALAWALLATGARVEAQARMRARAFGEEPAGARQTDALRAAAATLPCDTPLLAAYAAQFAAEAGEQEVRWSQVVTAWDEIGAPHAAAYARLRAAETAPRPRDDAAVGTWLRTAAGQAAQLGAAPLLEEIELVARSARVTLAAPEPSAGASDLQRLGLTGREAEVLRLVAAGRSNRQIAEQLVISPKTASVHVSRILAKLGAASRGEAAATAHRLHLFDRDQTG